ncbi:MAG: universal stress protein [Verrucomicrobiota bacterium]|nr:universal stress protein [Verrucomicrobiota bacterium]
MASDFSQGSNNAFAYALQIRERFGAHITVLHVLKPETCSNLNGVPGALADLEKQPVEARKELRAWVASAAEADPGAKLVVRTGLPAHEIVQAAKDLDADLVLLGNAGVTGWRHLCIGSTAEHVVRAAPCSVLVVREKERPFFC